MKKTRMMLLLVLLLSSFLLGGCGENEKNAALRVMVNIRTPYVMPAYIPQWSSVNSETVNKSMKFTGFDIDVITALAKKMGRDIKIESNSFEGMFNGIASKEADLAIGAISITEERAKAYDFSNPYLESGACVVAFRGDTVTKAEHLTDKHIGALVGTTLYDRAQQVKCAGVNGYASEGDLYKALFNGDIDALVMDTIEAKYDIRQKVLKRAEIIEILDVEPLGILINKDDKDLQNKVNKALKELKDSGEYQEIYTKWFPN